MTSEGASPVAPLRVLIVEDEFLVAMLLEDMLTELGHEIAGVAGRIDDAVRLAGEGAFDLAILDVHLGDATVFPVAEALARRAIPFVFATGCGDDGLPEEYRSRPTLQKPFQIVDLKRTLDAATTTG